MQPKTIYSISTLEWIKRADEQMSDPAKRQIAELARTPREFAEIAMIYAASELAPVSDEERAHFLFSWRNLEHRVHKACWTVERALARDISASDLAAQDEADLADFYRVTRLAV